jgi:hypothetical protein
LRYGEFRHGHPRIILTLPMDEGPVDMEFIFDSGFEGDIAMSDQLARRLDGYEAGASQVLLANGDIVTCPAYEVVLDDHDISRPVEVIALEGRPLVGTRFFADFLIQMELSEGGVFEATRL